jgi:hypothetical protein
MINLYTYSLGTIFLVGLAVIWAPSEIGWQLGSRGGGREGGNVSTLESAMLGLLALIIGFTFAMALSRFEARRVAVLNEANAIGTTALRARLLPESHRTDVLKLLKQYVQIRVDTVQSGPSMAELRTVVDRSNAIKRHCGNTQRLLSQKTIAWYPPGSLSRRSMK